MPREVRITTPSRFRGSGPKKEANAPGMVETENMRKRMSDEAIANEVGKIPLQRPGSMEEIADAVVFAVRCGYVTGDVINVNGGQFYTP